LLRADSVRDNFPKQKTTSRNVPHYVELRTRGGGVELDRQHGGAAQSPAGASNPAAARRVMPVEAGQVGLAAGTPGNRSGRTARIIRTFVKCFWQMSN